jgi:glycosyltransferase involved in cell wall biosynthesis
LYLNQAGLCRIVQPVARLFRLPLVIHIRLSEDIERCRKLAERTRAGMDLIFVSEDMRQLYGEQPVARERLHTCYDPYAMAPERDVHEAQRAHALACVGRISAGKGQRELVEALGLPPLRARAPDLHLYGVGVEGDSYAADLRSRVVALGLGCQVHFHGFRMDMPLQLRNVRFLVVPSRYESLGRVVMEAWEAGAVPIVSDASGGAAELIKRSGGGLLFRGHDAESIAGVIAQSLALSDAERERLVGNGRRWAGQHLSMAAYRQALAGVLFQP